MTLTYLLSIVPNIPIEENGNQRTMTYCTSSLSHLGPYKATFIFALLTRGSLKLAPSYCFFFGHMNMLKEENSFYN